VVTGVDVHVVVHDPLDVETHHSYEVAPVLAPHEIATGRDRLFCPFVGEILENTPGRADTAGVENIHIEPPFASVSPTPFVARACQ
jgi:hypothetical protein